MATALPPAPVDLDARIASPLDQLRGTIRRYVVLEGLLAGGLFVAIWFAGGLVLDYGAFKLLTWDWAVELPAYVRGAVLAVMLVALAALVASRVVGRLRRDLSYPSLAMVLERKFPDVLGDRLITAVELADVRRATGYGYSGEMIRATMDEARERVGRVPVSEVFNWVRLRRMAATLLAVVVGIVVVAFAADAATHRPVTANGFAWRSAHVAGIWAERNLLLMHTPWPRRAHLELVGYDDYELRVGKDAALLNPPKVRVRAVKWVVADPAYPLGWRAMRGYDLVSVLDTQQPLNVGPKSIDPKSASTVDDMERAPEAHKLTSGTFDVLNAMADDPALARTIRRLDVPQAVDLSYAGLKTSGGGTMAPENGGEFVGTLSELKESVAFRVRADDFLTPERLITLVPPPMLSKLVRTEYQPAYLHHPPPSDGGPMSLKGKRQRMADVNVSLTGDRSVFAVPVGTEVVLTAATDKPIRAAYIRPKVGRVPGAKPGSPDLVPVPVDADGNGFVAAFRGDDRVTDNVEFDLVFVDQDGVQAVRPVLIQKIEDQVPTVEMAADVLRKQGNVYLVTPVVRVPFATESVIRDDTALSDVRYTFEYTKVESGAELDRQARLAVGVWAAAPGPIGLATGVMPAFAATLNRTVGAAEVKQKGAAFVGRFVGQYRQLRRETLETLEQQLQTPLPAGRPELVRSVKLANPQEDYFDLKVALPALAVSASESQPQYRIDLNIVATDANTESEGGPRTGAGAEPIRLKVVSEAELLAEISKEEETLIQRLDDALRKLNEAKGKLSQVAGTLGTAEVINLAVRAQDVAQDEGKARDLTQAVLVEYRRILRECEANQVQKNTIERYATVIVGPLTRVLEGSADGKGSFPRAEQAHADMQGALNATQRPAEAQVTTAQVTLDELITELKTIREGLGEALSLDKLRNSLQAIIKRQKDVTTELRQWNERLQGDFKTPIVGPVGPLVLAKGESQKVKHAINWQAFEGDLKVKVKASDATLKVPATVAVDPEKFEFEYELAAGQKAGEFTVTVSPSAGKPVTIRVTVR